MYDHENMQQERHKKLQHSKNKIKTVRSFNQEMKRTFKTNTEFRQILPTYFAIYSGSGKCLRRQKFVQCKVTQCQYR